MTDRVLDVSEEAAHMSVRLDNLVVTREGAPDVHVPLADIAALVVSHPQASFTHAVVAGIAAAGGVLVACDEKHLPVGMLLPLQGHFVQTERFQRQVEAPLPQRKRLWQQIVRAKLRAQSRLLSALRGDDHGILELAGDVRSGDPKNIEAQAARRYWQSLFGEAFRRDPQREDLNRHLNYGYAVLRATVARAICGTGLHPSVGLHHHNRYDTFCLADDLMEPFRPLVDGAVVRLSEERGPTVPMDREAKRSLLSALTGRFPADGEQRTLFDLLSRTASSLAAVQAGEATELFLPEM